MSSSFPFHTKPLPKFRSLLSGQSVTISYNAFLLLVKPLMNAQSDDPLYERKRARMIDPDLQLFATFPMDGERGTFLSAARRITKLFVDNVVALYDEECDRELFERQVHDFVNGAALSNGEFESMAFDTDFALRDTADRRMLRIARHSGRLAHQDEERAGMIDEAIRGVIREAREILSSFEKIQFDPPRTTWQGK